MPCGTQTAKGKVEKMRKDLARGNWSCSVTPAVPGMGLGFSSGCLVAWRSSWQGRPLSFGSLAEKQGRAAFAELSLPGLKITVAALYLWVGVGPAGANLELLADVARILQGNGQPFLAFADWNLEPQDLRDTGWLAHVGADIVPQPSLQGTCTAGQYISYLDFFVGST